MYTSEADFKGACKALHMGTRVPMEVDIVIKGTAADFVITRVIWLLENVLVAMHLYILVKPTLKRLGVTAL